MHKKIVRVSVGIPAFNEEANIENTLRSILTQEGNFKLERILVISDGSTDKTNKVVTEWSKKIRRIHLIAENVRTGKAARLNQLARLNKSEILICLDADTRLGHKYVFAELLRPLINSRVQVAAGNLLPAKAQNFFNRITNAMFLMWYEIRKNYKNGDNIHNLQGAIYAIRNKFARKVTLPEKTIGEQQYLYYKLSKHNGSFVFVKEAVTLISLPTTFSDFYLQGSRSLTEKYRLANHIHAKILPLYYIPLTHKLKGIISAFLYDPFYTSFAIIFSILIRLMPPQHDPLLKKGLWTRVSTTKKLLSKRAKLAYYL